MRMQLAMEKRESLVKMKNRRLRTNLNRIKIDHCDVYEGRRTKAAIGRNLFKLVGVDS